MRKLSETELAKKQAAKVFRTMKRLEKSLEADRELNEIIPAVEAHIDSLAAQGKGFRLELPTIEIRALESGDSE